jgi:N-acetylmuramoyl-L-alanine amidase
VVRLTSGTLNLRQEPSLTAPVIGSIPNGATLDVLGETEDWYAVSWQGNDGFVSKVYVDLV